jgi:hypothetical protein
MKMGYRAGGHIKTKSTLVETYRYKYGTSADLQVAGICLIYIIDRILARLPAYFATHFNVQFNDRSPADQSG